MFAPRHTTLSGAALKAAVEGFFAPRPPPDSYHPKALEFQVPPITQVPEAADTGAEAVAGATVPAFIHTGGKRKADEIEEEEVLPIGHEEGPVALEADDRQYEYGDEASPHPEDLLYDDPPPSGIQEEQWIAALDDSERQLIKDALAGVCYDHLNGHKCRRSKKNRICPMRAHICATWFNHQYKNKDRDQPACYEPWQHKNSDGRWMVHIAPSCLSIYWDELCTADVCPRGHTETQIRREAFRQGRILSKANDAGQLFDHMARNKKLKLAGKPRESNREQKARVRSLPTCSNCGTKGHAFAECRNEDGGNYCTRCRIGGHRFDDCTKPGGGNWCEYCRKGGHKKANCLRLGNSPGVHSYNGGGYGGGYGGGGSSYRPFRY